MKGWIQLKWLEKYWRWCFTPDETEEERKRSCVVFGFISIWLDHAPTTAPLQATKQPVCTNLHQSAPVCTSLHRPAPVCTTTLCSVGKQKLRFPHKPDHRFATRWLMCWLTRCIPVAAGWAVRSCDWVSSWQTGGSSSHLPHILVNSRLFQLVWNQTLFCEASNTKPEHGRARLFPRHYLGDTFGFHSWVLICFRLPVCITFPTSD